MKPVFLVIMAAMVILAAGSTSSAGPAPTKNSKELDKMPELIGGLMTITQQVVYPKSAVKDGIEGKVLLYVVIDEVGRVKAVEIHEGVRRDLDQAAVKAVETSRWIPAQKDGGPVEAGVIVPIQFKLGDKAAK